MKGVINLQILKNIVYNTETGMILDIYLPEGETRASFLYMHGGGLVGGSHETAAQAFAPYLTSHGIAVFAIRYRFLTEAPYPACVEDAAAAVAFAKTEGVKYTKCEKLFVGGSSAGGYLSMMLCFDGRFLARHGLTPLDMEGFIHDAGQPTCHFNELKHRGIDPRRVIVDERAPLYHVGTAAGYPPMFFIVSDDDMKNRYEQTKLMVSTLHHFECDASKITMQVMHGRHCQYNARIDEDGNPAFGKLILSFVETVL